MKTDVRYFLTVMSTEQMRLYMISHPSTVVKNVLSNAQIMAIGKPDNRGYCLVSTTHGVLSVHQSQCGYLVEIKYNDYAAIAAIENKHELYTSSNTGGEQKSDD